MTDQELQLAEAVRELRTAVNDTQQRFSDRVGVVVRTVARWELEKPPSQPAILFRLAEVSRIAGREDLARVFDRATLESFIAGIIKQSEEFPASRPSSQLRALAWLMRAEPSAIGFYDRLDTFLIQEIASALLERGFGSQEDAKQLGDLGDRAFEDYFWSKKAAEGITGLKDAIRQIKDELKLGDEQLAVRLGVSVDTIQKAEAGARQPTSMMLVKLLQIADEYQLPCSTYFAHQCQATRTGLQASATPAEILADLPKSIKSDVFRQKLIRFLENTELETALKNHRGRPKSVRPKPQTWEGTRD